MLQYHYLHSDNASIKRGDLQTLINIVICKMFRSYLLVVSIFVFLFQVSLVFSSRGVDISQASTIAAFQCLKSKGYDWAVIRVYGKFSIIDAYIFPCFSCGNGAGQVEAMVKYIHSYKTNVDMVWFDIEGPGVYWSSDQSKNRDFFNSMLAGAKSAGVKVGVYTSESQWEPIMGSWTGGADYPLWYAHYDNNPSFSDFVPFGGWKKPHAKQYEGSVSDCGIGVDLNYY
ncbi:hypothetical protein PPL_00782 [Heterostelium album PN500]|uniref:Lysozyme n=1 Tax=Heterostelium pallidum (strain ATCC 26659 / Pp 5 / PN500) TaxID=670386 RepID=D3AXF1_HETP5|nr:hypothetical protein PPL_00782 [Heterostelium album PN500]EFA86220.1 hypothetical protein PPL_00782 [Heterostelium album PN500]|eukprot:XP_020438325.1 hypothetical protein PPL_00782 [Heterostelium album PN500]